MSHPSRMPRARAGARTRRSPFACKPTLVYFLIAALLGAVPTGAAPKTGRASNRFFHRIATLPVIANNCDGLPLTDACYNDIALGEIIAASEDGNTLIYIGSTEDAVTEDVTGNVGFVDITDPNNPTPIEVLDLPAGLPTSVAVKGAYALVAVNTSANFIMTSGELRVYDIASRSLAAAIPLSGQPDSVVVSPDGQHIVVVTENERDEDFDPTDGAPPQLPSGLIDIVDSAGAPGTWTTRQVSLVGVADKFPSDAEPEYADINDQNVAVVTLQENNHIVLIDLVEGEVIFDFPAGSVDLNQIDTVDEEDETGQALITLSGSLQGVPRESDAVAFVSRNEFATADEGDLDGGSRTFTIYRKNGKVLFSSGNALEHIAARVGHLDDTRSDSKGSEPEGIDYGVYGGDRLLFVGSERYSLVCVFRLPEQFGGVGTEKGKFDPELVQVLPGGFRPEGLLAMPGENLFVTVSEEDSREDKTRSVISIYKLQDAPPAYSTIESANRPDGTPIPWGALSALAADPNDGTTAYTVYDSFFQDSRIFKIDISAVPAVITQELPLTDGGALQDNLDPEGIWVNENPNEFLVAVEGNGNPAVRPNEVLRVNATTGAITERIQLPAAVNALDTSSGFEGVTSVGLGNDEVIYVCVQREWGGDPAGWVRIGRYEVATSTWTFFYYPLDAPTSPNPIGASWVGLSEIIALGGDEFAVIERDNQAGLDATIKRIYKFSTAGVTPLTEEDLVAMGAKNPADAEFPGLAKTLVRDLLAEGDLPAQGGVVIEKIEGLMVVPNGDAYILTDNDGAGGVAGETQLINLGPIF